MDNIPSLFSVESSGHLNSFRKEESNENGFYSQSLILGLTFYKFKFLIEKKNKKFWKFQK